MAAKPKKRALSLVAVKSEPEPPPDRQLLPDYDVTFESKGA